MIWLLFSHNTDGLVSLRAICTTRTRADKLRKYLARFDSIVRAWVREEGTDHIEVEGLFEISTYGSRIYDVKL